MEHAVKLENDTAPDPTVEDESDSLDATLAATGLPPLAIHWLKANPKYLYDAEHNARLQDLHHTLVAAGYEGYSGEYFLEMDRRLNNAGAVPDTSSDGEMEAAMRALEIAESRRDRIAELNRRYDDIIEATKSPVDRVLDEARASRLTTAADISKGRPSRASVSAPPSRQTPSWSGGQRTGSRITLTGAQKEAARIAGISEVEYAANPIRLEQEKAAGNYGGQP